MYLVVYCSAGPSNFIKCKRNIAVCHIKSCSDTISEVRVVWNDLMESRQNGENILIDLFRCKNAVFSVIFFLERFPTLNYDISLVFFCATVRTHFTLLKFNSFLILTWVHWFLSNLINHYYTEKSLPFRRLGITCIFLVRLIIKLESFL